MKPKYIRIFSDIHLDFDIPQKLKNFDPKNDIWTPNSLLTDKETILILAGDIWHAKKPFSFSNFSWFKNISKQFHSIVVLLGNHDFWGGNLSKEYDHYINYIEEQQLDNIHLLQNNTIKFDGIKIVGGTMWTNFNDGDYITLETALSTMNDYKFIKNGSGFARLKPTHLLGEFNRTFRHITENAHKDYPEESLWVVTHHAPSFQSIHPDYQDDSFYHMNGLYASNLEDYIKSNKDIAIWGHGHCHHFSNYKIGNTKIISNPRGYRFEQTQYKEELLFDLQGNLI